MATHTISVRESPTNLVEGERPSRVVPNRVSITAASGHGRLGVLVVVGARDNVVPYCAIRVPLDRHDHRGRVPEVKSADHHVLFPPFAGERKITGETITASESDSLPALLSISMSYPSFGLRTVDVALLFISDIKLTEEHRKVI